MTTDRPKMTSVTIITKRNNTMFDEKSIEEIGSTAFTHGAPLSSYDPDCDPVAYAARVLLEAGLLPELEPFYMVEDGIARRREAVRFALMEEQKNDEFPDIELPDPEPLTEEEQEAWEAHCDWFNNIMEYSNGENTPNTKEEDDLYKKGSPDLEPDHDYENDPDLDF